MKSFTFTVTDEAGIHARPAGLMAKEAKKFSSEILIEKNQKKVNAQKLMMLMGMGVKCGDTITVTINGDDEETAEKCIRKFLEENL